MNTLKACTSVQGLIVIGIAVSVAACASPPVQPTAAKKDDGAVKECSDTLRYVGSPLARVVSDINRCFGAALMIDEQTGQLGYRGTVNKQYVDYWLDGLEFTFATLFVDRTRPDMVLLRSRVASDPPRKN